MVRIREFVRQLFPLILPLVVLVVVPYLIQRDFEIPLAKGYGPWPIFQFIAGLALMVAGIVGLAWTDGLFIRIGKGTLAPWDPTKNLVVSGPYAHVRNPMITSVIIVLLGEALFFGSWTILVWTILAFVINHVYFIFSEEPGLAKRFGKEYEVYKKNVPRWLPRIRPWKPEGITSAIIAKENKHLALLIPGIAVSIIAIFIIVIILSFVFYVILPIFYYDSVQIPTSCIDNASSGSHLPSYLNYTIPGIGNGTLMASDNISAVVAMTDYDHLPFKSTIYLINKNNNKVIQSLNFKNDIIGAAIDDGTLYIFNDKIGYIINADTGEFVKNIVRIDNYRGIYISNNNTRMQTDLEISEISIDGSVSHRQMNMRCIAYGCLIS